MWRCLRVQILRDVPAYASSHEKGFFVPLFSVLVRQTVCSGSFFAGPQILGLIEPFVYEWTSERRGSVSAEHGLGFMKVHAMHYSQTRAAVGPSLIYATACLVQ